MTIPANIPAYLAAVQGDVLQIISAADRAAESIENSPAYLDGLHPFHAAAVSTYNALVSVLLTVEGYQIGEGATT